MGRSIKTEAYTKLVKDIAELCNHARKTLVESYWQIGRRIVEQEQQGDNKAEYGAQLLHRLSEDLQQKLGSGFSRSNLRNMRRFYLNNRIHQPAGELNWSQHVEYYQSGSRNPQAIYAQGIYLNQQLLDKGLARKWKP